MKIEHLSNSQVSMALKCGQQYAYRYGEGIKLPPGFAMVRGSSVDAGITENLRQKITSGADLPVTDVQDLAAAELEKRFRTEEVVPDPDDEGTPIDEARGRLMDEVVGLAGLHTQDVSPGFAPEHVQLKVKLKPSSILPVEFVGVLDVVDTEKRIRDTKTARKKATDSAALESDQLTAYDLLYRAHFKQEPSALQLDQLVRTPKAGELSAHALTSEPRDRSELFAYVARANAVLQMAEAERWTPAPDSAWWCSQKWCGYWGICKFARGRKRHQS